MRLGASMTKTGEDLLEVNVKMTFFYFSSQNRPSLLRAEDECINFVLAIMFDDGYLMLQLTFS